MIKGHHFDALLLVFKNGSRFIIPDRFEAESNSIDLIDLQIYFWVATRNNFLGVL